MVISISRIHPVRVASVGKTLMPYPPPPNNIGKIGKAKHPDGRIGSHKIVDEIHIFQGRGKTKLIYLQKLKLDTGKEELRLGYYIIGKKPAMRGRWVWGQYATFLPVQDFKRIISMAKSRGWLK
jgi:hypothetical protein